MNDSRGADGHEKIASIDLGALARNMGMQLLSVRDDGFVEISMPVEGNTQPLGLLHGGASAALAESAGSLAALLRAPSGMTVVGTELNITHHRSARSGDVIATASVIHAGRTSASVHIAIDQAGRRVATARLGCRFLGDNEGTG